MLLLSSVFLFPMGIQSCVWQTGLTCDSPSNAIWFPWIGMDGGIYWLWSLHYNKYNYGMGNFLLEFKRKQGNPLLWMICVSEWIRRFSPDLIFFHIQSWRWCAHMRYWWRLSLHPHCHQIITPLKQREWFSSWSVGFETFRHGGIFQNFIRIDLFLHSGNITTTWNPKPLQKSCLYKNLQIWGPKIVKYTKHHFLDFGLTTQIKNLKF